jgi:hypothetical protein
MTIRLGHCPHCHASYFLWKGRHHCEETDQERWERICREDWTGNPWDPRLQQAIDKGPSRFQ